MKIKELLKKKIEELIVRVKKIKKRSIYCVVAGIVLAIMSFLLNSNSIYIRPNEIERSSYGTQKTPYTLKVDAENLAKNMEFSVSVSSKKYTREEAEEKFEEKFNELLVDMLNENENYENINSKLNFKTDLGDGIKATYAFEPKIVESDIVHQIVGASYASPSIIATSSEADNDEFAYYVKYKNIIDGSGNVNNEDFKLKEYCTGHILIQFSTEIKDKEGSFRSEKYMVPIRVVSKKLSPIESFKIAFKKEVEDSDKKTIDKDTIILPKIVQDFRVIYKDRKDFTFLLMPIIGILTAILLEAKDKEEEKEKIKRRIRLLELDFAQIISKILLYVSSGMTIRNSMIRLAENYQRSFKNDENKEKRVAYEELVVVKNKLASGYSEIGAYEEMAKNINMRTYTRFLNIIIQSIKNGNKDLKKMHYTKENRMLRNLVKKRQQS